MWWAAGGHYGGLFSTSEADQLRSRQKLLARQLAENKLAMKRLKRSIRGRREERFNEKVAVMPARVERINIDGLGRTSDDIVRSKVVQLFQVQNFKDIITITKKVHKELKELGCFSRVNIQVDTVGSTKEHISHSNYQVHIKVEEIGPIFLNVGALAGQQVNEVLGAARGGLNNLLGRGERLEAQLLRGCLGSSHQQLTLTRPLQQLPAGSSLALCLERMRSAVPWMPLRQEAMGLSLVSVLAYSAASLTTRLAVDLVNTTADWRQLSSTGRKLHRWHPALSSTGSLMLASITNKFSLHLLDSLLLPSHGLKLAAGHVAAFYPGRGQLAYQQLWAEGSAYYPVSRFLSVGASSTLFASGGEVRAPLVQLSQHRHPLVARGARPPAPDFQGDSLVLAYCLSAASLLPLLGSNTLVSRHTRLHAFMTGHLLRAEGLTNWSSSSSWRELNHGVGIGILGRVADVGRWELNYCWPLYPRAGGPALSFGFSSTFL